MLFIFFWTDFKLERWCKGDYCPFFQKLSCEWKKDENKPLVGVIALIFIQCFDTDLVIGRVSGPQISAIYTVKFLYWSHSLSPPSVKARLVFTARCYASAVLAMALCLSVTSRSSTKTAERRITQTTPHDSPGTLVFWSQRSPRNSAGVIPYRGAKCRWGGSKSANFGK